MDWFAKLQRQEGQVHLMTPRMVVEMMGPGEALDSHLRPAAPELWGLEG